MRQTIDLNKKWFFTKDTEELPTEVPLRWNLIHLPHTWNDIDGQDGGNDYYRGKGYYAKELKRSELPEADLYYLQFKGANSVADVYVNGQHLGHHEGGYSLWRVDITPALKEDNLIVVVVDNSNMEEVYPQMADFTFYGGLYRGVHIVAVSKSHFDLEYYGGTGLWITPEVMGEMAKITMETKVINGNDNQTYLYRLRNQQGQSIMEHPSKAPKIEIQLPNPHLWHGRKDPYLYIAEVELIEGDEVIDQVGSRFGIRSFVIDPERGFLLNGEEYPLRGVSRHQDRWAIGNALHTKHHREDMELICDMGANTIRLAHYQHAKTFYDLCDEVGMIVWAEIPYISKHEPKARENTLSQMQELIVQNYNHPSIVVWGLSNEITIAGGGEDLVENHRLLNDLCHKMDPTRKTAVAAVSMCDIHEPYLKIPDVVAYNHYFGWYGGNTAMNGPWFDHFHEVHPNIPIACSEYGCEALDWHTSKPVQGDYTEEYQAYYHEELIKQLYSRPYLWATYVWNMFDFGADGRNEGGENGQNHKGLITFDRSYKKDAYYAYKAWLSDAPFVHICGKRYVEREETVTKVKVYSNRPKVELYANGKSLGKQTREDHFFCFLVPNNGDTELRAVAGDCEDVAYLRKVDEFPEKYRMKEEGALLNWFDITTPVGYLSLQESVGTILSTEDGRRLIDGMITMELSEGMKQMMDGFTLLRLIQVAGGMMNLKFTKEELLELNRELNQIPKMQ